MKNRKQMKFSNLRLYFFLGIIKIMKTVSRTFFLVDNIMCYFYLLKQKQYINLVKMFEQFLLFFWDSLVSLRKVLLLNILSFWFLNRRFYVVVRKIFGLCQSIGKQKKKKNVLVSLIQNLSSNRSPTRKSEYF